MKTPKCKKCYNYAILADAGIVRSIPYFYCKFCKTEVNSEGYDITEPLKALEDYLSSYAFKLEDKAEQDPLFDDFEIF